MTFLRKTLALSAVLVVAVATLWLMTATLAHASGFDVGASYDTTASPPGADALVADFVQYGTGLADLAVVDTKPSSEGVAVASDVLDERHEALVDQLRASNPDALPGATDAMLSSFDGSLAGFDAVPISVLEDGSAGTTLVSSSTIATITDGVTIDAKALEATIATGIALIAAITIAALMSVGVINLSKSISRGGMPVLDGMRPSSGLEISRLATRSSYDPRTTDLHPALTLVGKPGGKGTVMIRAVRLAVTALWPTPVHGFAAG